MAQAAWGTKRRCPSCGAHFYDLNKEPVICPKCDSPFLHGLPRKRFGPTVPLQAPPRRADIEEIEVEEEVAETEDEGGEDEEEQHGWGEGEGDEPHEDKGF